MYTHIHTSIIHIYIYIYIHILTDYRVTCYDAITQHKQDKISRPRFAVRPSSATTRASKLMPLHLFVRGDR